jgi:hypothetical protein
MQIIPWFSRSDPAARKSGPEKRPGKKVLSGCHFSKTTILGVLLA